MNQPPKQTDKPLAKPVSAVMGAELIPTSMILDHMAEIAGTLLIGIPPQWSSPHGKAD